MAQTTDGQVQHLLRKKHTGMYPNTLSVICDQTCSLSQEIANVSLNSLPPPSAAAPSSHGKLGILTFSTYCQDYGDLFVVLPVSANLISHTPVTALFPH